MNFFYCVIHEKLRNIDVELLAVYFESFIIVEGESESGKNYWTK